MANDHDRPIGDTVLEEPESIEVPDAGAGSVLSDDLSVLATKVNIFEGLFKLLTTDQKFQDFMRDGLLYVMRAVKCEAASILELNHRDQTFFFRAAVGHRSDRVVRFVIPVGQGAVGYVAEARQPLVVSDDHSKHLRAVADAIGFHVNNLVALPLLVRGKVFGVLELLNRQGESTFTESDVELLASICEVFSRAIEIRLMLAMSGRQGKKDVA